VGKLNSAIETLRDRGAPALCKAVLGLARTTAHRVTGRQFALCRVYDYRLWVDLNDRGISRTLMLFGERELEHKAMLERIVEPGMRIFDIGANIGYYAIMESQLVGPSGQVVAIEPSPGNVALLQRNLEQNAISNVVVREGAISDEEGKREFHLSTQSNLNTFHDIGSGAVHLAGESIPVEVNTVPALAEEFGPPDVMRMDVEGHEVEVIRGLLDAVEAGTMRPRIIFETHLSRYTAEHSFEPVLRRLFAAGYEVSLAASSWERGTEVVETFGYKGVEKIRSDGVIRTLFESISADDAVKLICETGGLRTVILSPSA
jgi:FkbM family methyltransferase